MPDRFRTELPVSRAPWSIDHGTYVMTTGSCFADHIGERLAGNKFPVSVNPLGTAYNPVSIHRSIKAALDTYDINAGLVESQGTWRHFDFHSKWSDQDRNRCVAGIESRLKTVREQIVRTNVLMITYGTSWVYVEKQRNEIVSNCHKRPAAEFSKRLLTVDDIVESFGSFTETLRSVNPDLRLILTLSPVRHTKDTLELNQVSKSILRTALYEIGRAYPHTDYFPAYEVVLDDLRDYRFYEPDLIHPNGVAIDYIWEKFGQRYFTKKTSSLCERWQKVSQSLQHRPFHAGSRQHAEFLAKMKTELELLSGELDVSHELATLGR